jgi:hypothetical protein
MTERKGVFRISSFVIRHSASSFGFVIHQATLPVVPTWRLNRLSARQNHALIAFHRHAGTLE